MADEAKRAKVTNNAEGPRWIHTATGPVVLQPGAAHEDYFSEGEIKAMKATGLMDVEMPRGKAAEHAKANAPELGASARLPQKVPGSKAGRRMKAAKKK